MEVTLYLGNTSDVGFTAKFVGKVPSQVDGSSVTKEGESRAISQKTDVITKSFAEVSKGVNVIPISTTSVVLEINEEYTIIIEREDGAKTKIK